MAIARIQGSQNIYSKAHDRLKRENPLFNESDWDYLIGKGDYNNIDLYIAGAEALKDQDPNTIFDFDGKEGNSVTRFMTIVNEAFGKTDTTVRSYFVPWSPDEILEYTEKAKAYNEQYQEIARGRQASGAPMFKYENEWIELLNQGGKEESLTSYEYTKRLINNENMTLDNAVWDTFVKEAKSPEFWKKLGGSAVSLGANFLIGADVGISSLVALGLHGLNYLIFGALDDLITWDTDQWDVFVRDFTHDSRGVFTANQKINGKSFQDVMVDFESEYTYFRDEYGNLTSAGNIFVNAARTAGEMVASSFMGGGIAKAIGASVPTLQVLADGTTKVVGYTSKMAKLGKLSFDLARITSTAVYYAPIAARSMTSNYLELSEKDPSISTAAVVAHSLTSTAAEIAIEVALGKLFGATGLDKWLFGAGTANPKIVKNFWQILGRTGLDIAQEGTEEALQEMSNVAIDNIFGLAVNENFGELSSLDAQTIGNAFTIGCLVSGGHASVQLVNDVISASPITIRSEDGTVTKLSKIDSLVYNYNVASYMESVKATGDKMADALDTMYKALPVSEQLIYLSEELADAKSELSAYESEVKKTGGKTAIKGDKVVEKRIAEDQKAGRVEGKVSKYRKRLQELRIKNLKSLISDLEGQIGKLKTSVKSSQTDAKKVTEGKIKKTSPKYKDAKFTAKQLRKVSKDFKDAFAGMYASMRMLKAFSNEMGEEQFTRAESLLKVMSRKVEEGKLDPVKLTEAVDEFISTLQLKSIKVTARDIKELKRTGNVKMLKFYDLLGMLDEKKKKDTETTDTTATTTSTTTDTTDVDADENSDEYKKDHATLLELANGSSLENVVITESGSGAVELSDEKTVVVPKAELEQGSREIFKDLGERKLVKTLMSYPFKGNVIQRIVNTYKDIYGADKTEDEAIYAICFDPTFFITMLDGDVKLGVKLADSDMFQFLSSLQKLMDSVVPNDVKTQVYKDRIAQVQSKMTEALFEYVKMQPYAEYRLDIFTDAQKSELIQLRESGKLVNRFVSGKFTPADVAFMNSRIDALPLPQNVKDELKKDVTSNRPTNVKKALSAIDEQYEIIFNGSRTGKIYMPSNNLKNRSFNQFLYQQGLTIDSLLLITQEESDLLNRESTQSEKSVLQLRSEQFNKFSNGRYSLQILPGKDLTPDPSNSSFKAGNFLVTIVSTKSTMAKRKSADGWEQSVYYGDSDTPQVAYRAGRNTELVNSIVADDVIKDYYVIDDIISNPTLLSAEIKDQIVKEYGELTDENVYSFLKGYFIEKTGNISISLLQNGEIVFVDLKDSTKMVDESKVSKIVDGMKLSELIKSEYQIPFFDEVTVVWDKYGASVSNRGRLGKNDWVLTLSTKAKLSKPQLIAEIAHEAQHAIQIANKLNYGNDAEILKKLFKDDKDKIINEVKKNLPELFKDVEESEYESIVNDFLYYASGEAEAYGHAFSDVVKFYPVVIKMNEDKTYTLTLPWGTTVTTVKRGTKASMRYKNIRELNDTYMKLAMKHESIDDFSRFELRKLQKLVDEIAKLNGFDSSTPLYHGTQRFGFTKAVTSDMYVGDNLYTSSVFSEDKGVRQIGFKDESVEDLDEVLKEYEKKYGWSRQNDLATVLSVFKGDPEEEYGEVLMYLYGDDAASEFFENYDEETASRLESALLNVLTRKGNYRFYAKNGKRLIIDAKSADWTDIEFEGKKLDTKQISKIAKERGYDSVLIKSVGTYKTSQNEYIYLYPNRDLRSADPITYDDAGNVIPLTERFKTESEDFRYRTQDETDARINSQNEKMLNIELRIEELVKGEHVEDFYSHLDFATVDPFTGEVHDLPDNLKGKKVYQQQTLLGLDFTTEPPNTELNLKQRIKSIVDQCIADDVTADLFDPDFYALFIENFGDYLVFDYRIDNYVVMNVYNNILDVIKQSLYSDTFYSQMNKAIEGMKDGKQGAQSVIAYLKGKGVKDEEIKWSGIQEFLAGKKSVTKEELLEFAAGAMLEIEERMLTGGETHWDAYRRPEGRDYREILFKIPNSDYTNQAIGVHWGDEKGVLAHARVSDVYQNGERILFVDEIQSDWHNAGHKEGYRSETQAIEERRNKTRAVRDAFIEELSSILTPKDVTHVQSWARRIVNFGLSNEERKIAEFNRFFEKQKLPDDLKKRIEDYRSEYSSALEDFHKIQDLAPDAPFKDAYHEFVMKRLIRMAAENGYDKIAWTPTEMQMERWNPHRRTYRELGEPYLSEAKNPDAIAFEEGYRIEYDQDIPKFLRKYGKKWGVEVKKEPIGKVYTPLTFEQFKDSFRSDVSQYFEDSDQSKIEFEFETRDDGTFWARAVNYDTGEVKTSEYEPNERNDLMWSMNITDSMKESVLKEGQPLYDRAPEVEWDVDEKLANKMPENATLDDVKTLFKELNEDSDVDALFDKVYSVVEKLSPEGLKLSFSDTNRYLTTPDSKGRYRAAYYHNRQIVYYRSYLASQNVDPQFRATVLLHELIHYAVSEYTSALEVAKKTRYLIDPITGDIHRFYYRKFSDVKPDKRWSEGLKGAVALAQIFEQISVQGKGTYGGEHFDEFIAELSNPEFRRFLKGKNLWQKIIDAIKRLFGIGETNVLKAADNALNKVLDSYADYKPYVPSGFFAKLAKRGPRAAVQKANKHTRRVPIKKSRDTNLEAFGGQQLSESMQGFINEAWYTPDGGINKGLWLKIKEGTLKRSDIFHYFYLAPGDRKRDKATFDLINKHFFKNPYIESFEELDKRVVLLPQYYAIMKMFKNHHLGEQVIRANDPNLYDLFMNALAEGKISHTKFNKYVTEFESNVDYDPKTTRRLWMRNFDGSIYSVASIAETLAFLHRSTSARSTTEVETVSLDANKEGKDGQSRSLEEMIADRDMEEAASADEKFFLRLYTEGDDLYDDSSEALDVLSSFGDDPEALRAYVLKALGSKAEDPAFEAGMKQLALILESSKTRVDLDTDIQGAITKAAKRMSLRTPRNMVQNIKHHAAGIKSLLLGKTTSAASRRQFLKDTEGIFDENFDLLDSAYKSKNAQGAERYHDEATLLKLEKTLQGLKKSFRKGVYDKKYVDLRRESEEFMKMVRKTLEDYQQGKPADIVITNDEIRVNPGRKMPPIVEQLLNTQLKKSAKTRVQMLSEENEVHVKMTMKVFIEDNIEALNALTQSDVDEIIDYFTNTSVLPDTSNGVLYITVQQFMLAYLWKASEEGDVSWSLTNQQIKVLEDRLKVIPRIASTAQVNWREILRKMSMLKERTAASMRFYDLNLSLETQDLVIAAVEKNDVTAIKNAKAVAYKELRKKYRKRKTTFWEKATNLQRVMMLSSPGTWMRNLFSNLVIGGVKTKSGKTVLPGLNDVTELLNLLPQTKASRKLAAKDLDKKGKPKKQRVYTQYKIAGTKVSETYRTFIKEHLLDNGYMELISDGLIKYSTSHLRSNNYTAVDKVVSLVKSAVENQLFEDSNIAQRILSFVMSDKRAINKTTLRYLGKMLTEDAVDVSKGMTEDILPYIADAYVMAAQDFMHRPNFFTKLEYWGKNYIRAKKSPGTADAIYFLYKQVLPFASSSWNWFVDKLDYTPYGLAKGIIDLCKLETTVDKMMEAQMKGIQVRSQRFAEYLAKRQIGKGIIGTVLLGIGILLRAFNKAGIDDEDDKYKIWIGEGSDRIYIDLSNLHGTNSLTIGMAMADGFVDLRSGSFNVDKFLDVFVDILDEMFNDFVLTDVYNTVRRYRSLSEFAVDMPVQSVEMFIPKFLGTVSSSFRSKRIRYSSGFQGDLEYIAGSFFDPLNRQLGATYWINPYTGKPELINKSHWLTVLNKYSPVKVNQYEVGFIEEKCIDLDIRAGELTGAYEIDGTKIKLDGKTKEELNTFYGKRNAKDLADFFDGKTRYRVQMSNGSYRELRYSSMNDEQKKAVIERIMRDNSQLAKIYILTKDGKYKYYASDSEYQELRKLGITTNVYRKTNKLEGFVKN